MPEFYEIAFDAGELDAIRRACEARSRREDGLLDEASECTLEAAAARKSRADDALLLKGAVSIFRPGQAILITGEDLEAIRDCLEGDAPPLASATEKIRACLASGAGRR